MLEWLVGHFCRVLGGWLMIAFARVVLRTVTFGFVDGSDETFLYRRQGRRLRLGWFLTMLASFATWTAAIWLIATVLDRHASG